jgi:hypothetical protein
MINLDLLRDKVEQFTSHLEKFHINPDTRYHSSVYENLKNVYIIECSKQRSAIETYFVIARIIKIEGSGTDADTWIKDFSDLYFGWDAESGITTKKNMYKEKDGYLWAVTSRAIFKANEQQIIKLMNFLKYELVQLAFANET